ncbi:MAG: Rrf2 family transcriptional regulator [Bryobacterales bacterium]|nr:Rrf2 family transcriptional regulator [Bryobacteraceae bacterium]MDW8354203.1 Rrf2 family transcriptional regulator [Bryobacterales bacterium]
MKLSSPEEYGLRCLLRMARAGGSVTIPELSEAEGLSEANVAKVMRRLRLAGLVESVRGPAGGYRLARPPERITAAEVLQALGERLLTADFCRKHAGLPEICVHAEDCSLRALLAAMQGALDSLLSATTIKDLLGNERQATVQIAARLAGVSSAPRAFLPG